MSTPPERSQRPAAVAWRLQRRQLLWQAVVGTGVVALGPRALRSAGPAAVDLGAAVPVAAVVPSPAIVTRPQWGADESLRSGSPDFAPVHRAIVHHTVTSTAEPDPAGRVRAIYRFHTQGNGWSDIGYNFVVDADGRVYEGRSAGAGRHDGEDGSGGGVIGAHAGGHNTGSVGIAILGTYTSGGSSPAEAALDAVSAVVAWKFGGRGIDPLAPGTVIGHRDVVATGCPGDGLQQRLPEIRDRARARIAAAAAPAAADDSGLIEDVLDVVNDLL